MADCLSTPLIIQEILQNFSSTELLQLSLVNKQWNHEARSLMRSRGDLTARINKDGTCEDLRTFASHLRRLKEMKKVIPFSGMTIVLSGCSSGHGNWCEESSARELDQVYEGIADQMRWKHLEVSFGRNWVECKNCPAFLLVRKVFQKYCSVLEELWLRLENKSEFIPAVLQNCTFPSLKTLRLRKESTPRMPNAVYPDDTLLIKTLVSAAPNLQVLITEGRLDLNANLLEGSSAVHLTDYPYSTSRDEVPESIVGELGVRRMKLDFIGLQFSMERFNRITFTLLQNCRTTLFSMEIYAIFLVPLMRYRICLEGVKDLSLKFTGSGSDMRPPLLWRLVKSFDFTRIFPNLTTVRIEWMSNSDSGPLSIFFKDMIEQENTALIDPVPDRAENIKSLSLEWVRWIQNPSLQFLVHLFPDVQKLSIHSTEMIPFSSVWDSWLDLKELDVTLCAFRSGANFDSAFCGIFPEEAAQLQEEDEEYLRNVNIVPVMPSITCLKGLRTLNMSLNKYRSWSVERMDDPTFVLSKVTGLLAFQRHPALAVTLTTDDGRIEEALSHLKPFASVVFGSLTDETSD